MNSNRCFIANSLDFEIHDEDQEDYIMERVTKGLEIKWVPWIVDCDGGNIVEVDDGPRIILSLSKRFTRKRKKEEFKKEAFKKGA
ncbi:hypothetical protein RclHR1_03530005 [Rhizophagus clarus]|uniref:Uncharacterized protein n=1 Tax=Rhizophagus clarus TaxID=94130 RepID=A0A2Z6S5T2_9GLOM|nr:hypothetical protein RclHR1_03530005 [Rhizophagus clarus]